MNIEDDIKIAIKQIENKFGRGVIINKYHDIKDNTIPTGSLSLDMIIGNGGIPKGRITEIFGGESSGKTTIALQCAAICQKNGGLVAFIDAENALDINYAEKIGIDTTKLILAQPDNGEQAFSIIETLAKTNQIDLIIVDSVAALVPKSEIEAEIHDQNMGLHARLMSKGIRTIQGLISKTNTAIIFINQLREKIGMIYGNPEITTGGRALKFFSSLRLEVRKNELLKSGTEPIGIRTKITSVKNKCYAPMKVAFVDIFFDKGYDYDNEIINFSITNEIIKKNGCWYYYNDLKLAQGRVQLNQYLNNNKILFDKIKNELLGLSENF
ncbi:MAG: recombinase RecA [Mycoplasmoidaceae bacterium]